METKRIGYSSQRELDSVMLSSSLFPIERGLQRVADPLLAKGSPLWRRSDEQGISADFLVKVDDVLNVQPDPFVGTWGWRTYQASNP